MSRSLWMAFPFRQTRKVVSADAHAAFKTPTSMVRPTSFPSKFLVSACQYSLHQSRSQSSRCPTLGGSQNAGRDQRPGGASGGKAVTWNRTGGMHMEKGGKAVRMESRATRTKRSVLAQPCARFGGLLCSLIRSFPCRVLAVFSSYFPHAVSSAVPIR